MFQGGVGELTASSLPQSLVARVKSRQGVADATPIAVATGELREKPSFLVFGVEADSFVWRSLVFVAGRGAQRGDQAVLGDAAARDLGVDVGQRLRLAAGSFRVVGIYHAGVPFEDQGAALPLAVVERMRGRPGDATTDRGQDRTRGAGVRGRRPARARVPGNGGDQAGPARSRASTRTASSCARRPWSSPPWR